MQKHGSNGEFPSKQWLEFLDVWSSGQVCLPNVIRWTRYIKEFDELRLQNCLQHSYSISVMADMIMIMLEPYVQLDKHLLNTAFLIHDIGEGELKRDVPYADKVEVHDLQEYEAFCQRFGRLPQPVFDHYQRAFLLQFCLKNPETFPEDAREIMAELAEEKRMEALAFTAIEHWDYFMYGLEQYRQNQNGYILHIGIDAVVKTFNRINGELPGLDEVIWHGDLKQWCLDFHRTQAPCPCGGYGS